MEPTIGGNTAVLRGSPGPKPPNDSHYHSEVEPHRPFELANLIAFGLDETERVGAVDIQNRIALRWRSARGAAVADVRMIQHVRRIHANRDALTFRDADVLAHRRIE